MATKPPPHPGQYIKDHVLPNGMSVKKAAETVGVGRPAMSNLLNGNAKLSPTMAARLSKAFGVAKDELLEVQRAYDNHMKKDLESELTVKGFAPSFLKIRAKNISEWADSIEARSLLPALLRKLVLTSGLELRRVDFPAYDQSQTPGWDGIVEAENANPWVPKGASGWEFGCNKVPLTKANGDYAQRVKNLPLDERKAMSFVFVTPHLWPGKRKWAEDKARKNEWKKVIAIDADDLEQWIETSVPAQVMLAEEFGLPAEGCQSAEQYWRYWSNTAKTPISPVIFRSAIESSKQKLIDWYNADQISPLVIAAASKEEALAFISCALQELDELERLNERVVLMDQPSVIHTLSKTTTEIVPIVYSDETEIEAEKSFKGRRVIVVTERKSSSFDGDILVELPSYRDFSDALKDMGYEDSDIDILSSSSGNSPTILRRQLATSPALKKPSWATTDERIKCMVPYVLVGNWNTARVADKEILKIIAGKEYLEIEKDIGLMSSIDDSPIWCEGTHRGVVSKLDCLSAIAGLITKEEFETFLFAAEYVLSEDDPALDLDKDDRWAANIHDKVRDHSSAIRDSICETLVVLSIYGQGLFGDRIGVSVSSHISYLIKKLLSEQNERVWESQKGDLPLYAEAAPEVFLDIVEDELASDNPAFSPLFLPASTGVFGSCDRTGMLWALELLAWAPSRLSRVTRILAHLSQYELDDNWANKPINSLKDIYLHWMPQTAASVEQRIQIMESLKDDFPEVCWQLCYEQVKPGSSSTSGTYKPKYRNDASGFGQVATRKEGYDFCRACLDEMLSWSTFDVNKLKNLVAILASLDSKDSSRIFEIIQEWYGNAPESDEVIELREYVRRMTFTRRARIHAKGNEGNEGEEAYANGKKIYELLEPNDPLDKYFWLFKEHWVEYSPEELEDDDIFFEERDQKLDEQRKDALRLIHEKHGNEGLLKLVLNGNGGMIVGRLCSKYLFDFGQIVDLVEDALRYQSTDLNKVKNFLCGVFAGIEVHELAKIVGELENRLTGSDEAFESKNTVYNSMPFDRTTWDFIKKLGAQAQKRYWETVYPSWSKDAEQNLDYVVECLMSVDRSRAAFHLAHLRPHALSSSNLVALLDAIGMEPAEEERGYMPSSWDIEKALETLNSRNDVTRKTLARLEFFYIEVLTPTAKYGIPNLSKEIAESPKLFMQVVATCFKRNGDGDDPEGWKLYSGSEKNEAVITGAWRMSEHANVIPGISEDGKINEANLREWIKAVRDMAKNLDRVAITDQRIGQLLSHSPIDERDGVWPLQEIRNVVEDIASRDIAVGLEIGLFNSHGAEFREVSGQRELQKAKTYEEMAEAVNAKQPFVGKMLSNIAGKYTDYARWYESDDRLDRRLRGR